MTVEKRNMTTDDFLSLMDQNADVYPEFAALSPDDKLHLAKLNAEQGSAESFWVDDKLVGVGGVRCIGVGEAWMVVAPGVRKDTQKSLLRETKETFIRHRDGLGLWRVFAETKISRKFLEHIGFKRQSSEFLAWTRTQE